MASVQVVCSSLVSVIEPSTGLLKPGLAHHIAVWQATLAEVGRPLGSVLDPVTLRSPPGVRSYPGDILRVAFRYRLAPCH